MRAGNCLSCSKRAIVARGLCRTHHRLSCIRVRAGETTWERLIAAGLALPAKKYDIKLGAERPQRDGYHIWMDRT